MLQCPMHGAAKTTNKLNPKEEVWNGKGRKQLHVRYSSKTSWKNSNSNIRNDHKDLLSFESEKQVNNLTN